jgi:hypothetical protein
MARAGSWQPPLSDWDREEAEREEQPEPRSNRIRLTDLRQGLECARSDLVAAEQVLAALPEGHPRRRRAVHDVELARRWIRTLEGEVGRRHPGRKP